MGQMTYLLSAHIDEHKRIITQFRCFPWGLHVPASFRLMQNATLHKTDQPTVPTKHQTAEVSNIMEHLEA